MLKSTGLDKLTDKSRNSHDGSKRQPSRRDPSRPKPRNKKGT